MPGWLVIPEVFQLRREFGHAREEGARGQGLLGLQGHQHLDQHVLVLIPSHLKQLVHSHLYQPRYKLCSNSKQAGLDASVLTDLEAADLWADMQSMMQL